MPRKKSDTVQLKVRMKEPLRARLEKAAKSKGLSLNAEAVARLEKSFRDEEALHKEFGGKQGYNFMRWFAMTMRMAGQRTQRFWLEDPETFLIGVNAWKTIRMKGEPEGSVPSEEDLQEMGEEIADRVVKIAKKGRKKD